MLCIISECHVTKNQGISRRTNKNFLPIFAQGLPAMFLAGMNVLKAIRLRGGCAAAGALAS